MLDACKDLNDIVKGADESVSEPADIQPPDSPHQSEKSEEDVDMPPSPTTLKEEE